MHLSHAKKIPGTKLREALGMSVVDWRRISETEILSPLQISRWATLLGIVTKDINVLYDYNERWAIYSMLNEIKTLHPDKRRILADTIFFSDSIPTENLMRGLLPEVLPRVQELPYELKNAIEDMNDHSQK
jgi:hypothetical protein